MAMDYSDLSILDDSPEEEITVNPIICIGNYHIDKKIKELMKVCISYELKQPTIPQIKKILA